MFDCVFDAGEFVHSRYIAGHAHGEQITETLIKNDFRRHSRIRTAKDDGVGILARSQFLLSLWCFVRVLVAMSRVVIIADF